MKALLLLVLAALPACAPPRAASAPVTTGSATTSIPAPPCTEPERRELDFWLGDWDLIVSVRKDPNTNEWNDALGVSTIRSAVGGCAIEENFHAAGPQAPWAGRSFSTYVPALKSWRQTWVDDSGSYLAFTGGRDAAGFALYGEPREVGGTHRRMRMVFREITADSLVWSWEQGTEPETDWNSVMKIRYARHRAAAPGAACDADRTFHELDFWLGNWRVMSGGKEVGTNRIDKILGGCAVLEQWKDADGTEGRSLFFHPPSSSLWKQVWVTPAATSVGGSKEKQLVARGADGSLQFQGELPLPSGEILLDRTTLTPLAGGRVHQVIEISRDIGAHWVTTFEGTYERN